MLIELSILVLFLFTGIALMFHHAVRKMLSSPEAREEPAAATEIKASLPVGFDALLGALKFRFTQAYSFHGTRLGVWTRISPDPPLRLFYIHKQSAGIVYEFITEFSDENSLTTTMTRAAFVFPRPYGSFIQSFPRAKPEELWQLHLQGEDYLTSKLAIRVEACQLPFLESFKSGMIRNLSHVTSIRFWFVRGIYWYLVKRFLLHNRPISNQEVSVLYRKSVDMTGASSVGAKSL